MESKKSNPLEIGVGMRYDDESMKKKFESLSKNDKEIIDNCTDTIGQFSFENIVEIILSANEEQRKEISIHLADIRMYSDLTIKKKAVKELVELLNTL
jgi:hypothetical protein